MIADRAQAWLRRPERKSRLLYGALIAAVLLHLVWFAGLLWGPRLYARLSGHPVSVAQSQPRYATIEMIMQNTKTSGGNHILKDKESNPGRPASKATKQQATSKPSPAIPPAADGMASLSMPSPQVQAAKVTPSPDPSGGNPGTGLVSGPSVIPASPDDKHPNLPPAYPSVAGILGEQGTVQMLIHINANGVPTAVDITQSSGVLDLDETARKAAEGWRYRPPRENGRPVPSALPFAMEFSVDSSPNQ